MNNSTPNLAYENVAESAYDMNSAVVPTPLITDLYGVPPFDYPHQLFQEIYDNNSPNEYMRVGGTTLAPKSGLQFGRCQRCKRKCEISKLDSCPCLNYLVPVKCMNGETECVDVLYAPYQKHVGGGGGLPNYPFKHNAPYPVIDPARMRLGWGGKFRPNNIRGICPSGWTAG